MTDSQLTANSVLGHLPLHRFQVCLTDLSDVIATQFDQQPGLPGAIVVEGDRLVSMISRHKFLERMSRQFSQELFLRRPVQVLLAFIQAQPLLLPDTCQIDEAAYKALGRAGEEAYEPIVVTFGDGSLRLLDIHMLLLAQAEVLKLVNGQLVRANQEIESLNEQLQSDNLRMSAELAVTRQLQQMILPKQAELQQISELEISGFMEPATEVGGDYYDVLQHQGQIKIGIGDVTGHGLECGVLMIMVQTAVRTLMTSNITDPHQFLGILNRVIYKNVQRMETGKNLTLSLLDYQAGQVCVSGQHEEMLVIRANGEVERVDTADLGFPIGLEPEIEAFVAQICVQLQPGDGVVLYTDGITEAENEADKEYGLERLCQVVSQNWQRSTNEIRQAVVEDVKRYRGDRVVDDDITLLVLKQK